MSRARSLPKSTIVRSGHKKSDAHKTSSQWTALGFLFPNLVGFLAFTFFPVLLSFGMAFTNWSLKPAVPFQVVGLRNFVDLLGARPIGVEQPVLLAGYVLCVVAVMAGLIGALWANMEGWRGTRPGAAILSLSGMLFLLAGIRAGSQGTVVAALVATIAGIAGVAQDRPWGIGRGSVPALALLLGAGGLLLLQPAMTRAYEPRDPYFYQYLYNTVFLMLGIPFSIAGSLALALLLHEDLPTGPPRQRVVAITICVSLALVLGAILWRLGDRDLGLVVAIFFLIAATGLAANVVAFRTLFYLPTFTAGVALMILWQALYNPKTGPINVGLGAVLELFGVHAQLPEWLGSAVWAKPALIVMGVWTGIGGMNMLLYLAGLANLPAELLEAADLDGAGSWSKFAHVIWPQLAPTTFFITIMSIIGGLQGGFEQARVMTNGGPAGSTTTLSYYIYNKAFQDLDMGYAASISWVLFAIVFVAAALNWRFGKGIETEG
jgi:multiple sugar transport system permease protein